MTSRALIIAIGNYAGVQGMVAQTIDGAIESAQKFEEWVREKWRLENAQATELIFCSEPQVPGGRGATFTDICRAMLDLKQHGQNMTDELFVYFHGHGFRYETRPGVQMDVLVPSDFVGTGNLCIRLDVMVAWLRAHLGGKGSHYHFINACRNIVQQAALGDVPELFLPWGTNVSDATSLFMIQSIAPGRTAPAMSAFGEELRNGLAGQGTAKVWRETGVFAEMQVNFSSLFEYLQKKMADATQSSNGSRSTTDAVIRVIDPPLEEMLEIEILGLPAGTQGSLTLIRLRDDDETKYPLQARHSISCFADRYRVRVAAPGLTFAPTDRLPADLLANPKLLTFTVDRGREGTHLAGSEMEKVPVDLEVPRNATVELTRLDSGKKLEANFSDRIELPPGSYESVLRSANGTILRRGAVEIASVIAGPDGKMPEGGGGEVPKIRPGTWRGNAVQEEIASKLPDYAKAQDGDDLQFAESLGWMDDPDPQLWLTILGGSRIIGTDRRYRKLSGFSLRDFSGMRAGESAVYVLAGFENPETKLQVTTGSPEGWVTAIAPEGMPTLREWVVTPIGGDGLLRFKIGDLEPVSIASAVLPDRVTLVVLTLNREGAPVFDQFLLPVRHLIPGMDPEVKRLLEDRNLLADVKFVYQASRAFRKKRELWEEFPRDQLDMLLYAKWLDPMGACLAAYEKLRLRDSGLLNEAVGNLLRFFPGLPDSIAIARMAAELGGQPENASLRVPGIPLFLNGWLSVRESVPKEFWPKGDLDYSASLSTWWGGVEG